MRSAYGTPITQTSCLSRRRARPRSFREDFKEDCSAAAVLSAYLLSTGYAARSRDPNNSLLIQG